MLMRRRRVPVRPIAIPALHMHLSIMVDGHRAPDPMHYCLRTNSDVRAALWYITSVLSIPEDRRDVDFRGGFESATTCPGSGTRDKGAGLVMARRKIPKALACRIGA